MSLLRFAEALGIQPSMDWDDSVSIEYPEVVCRSEMEAALAPVKDCLAREFTIRARRRREVLVGGPFNGQPNRWDYCRGATFGRRVARAHWAVYREGDDGRAFFIGFASSQRKARRGALKAPGRIVDD